MSSPLEPELVETSLARPGQPLFEPPEECPVEHCLFGPVTLTRGTGAPTVLREAFEGIEGQEATLVVLVSDPRTTTLKGWLSGLRVLRPSMLPRSGSDEVRVPVSLEEDKVLRLRLSAKPGTQVVVWVEGEGAAPTEPPPPPPSMELGLTETVWSPQNNLSGACSTVGDGFVMADWNDIVQAVDEGLAKEDILGAGLALILNGGAGTFSVGFPPQLLHHMVSADGPDANTIDSAGPDLLWLTGGTSLQPVLCVAPGSAP